MMRPRHIAFLSMAVILVITAFSVPVNRTISLPGTQPNVVQTFEPYSTGVMMCQTCHQTQGAGRVVTITAEWQGSMMAHSARDPIFYATVAVANKYVSGAGDFCIRCHSPTGWLEGRSGGGRGDSLRGNDLNGVQCDFCHRMKDPMIPDSTVSLPVPGYGNGMFVLQVPRSPKRGPYTDALASGHSVQADPFQRSSNFCGVCHNVSNPLYATDPVAQSPHLYGPIERTYSEWLLSWFATQGESGSCQSCHMPPTTGYGSNLSNSPLRNDLPQHDLTGGNTFLPDILADFWTGLDTARISAGKQRTVQTLQSAALLEANAFRRNDTVTASVRVTNLTGHKLPTGYPEGRRMWVNLVGRNANGDTIFQSGAYNFLTADLTLDPQVKVYEIKPGLTPARAGQLGLLAGPSFHFILNDTIYFDNRIPPVGFNNTAFASHNAQPVAYSYPNGQFWDNTTYRLPSAVTNVTATLYYQTASKEYITFLRDENVGNVEDWKHWGDSLYSAWSRRGKSRPVSMATITVQVIDLTTDVSNQDENLPARISLKQNYPNPFNPTTTIQFTIPAGTYGNMSLRVFDLLGREVATLVNRRIDAGDHGVVFDAKDLPSGVYVYRLSVGNSYSETKKLMLIR